MISREDLLDVSQAGVQAPSADNHHVFRIELGESMLSLWPTPALSGSAERHRRVLGLISLGAVVENMRLRAADRGLDCVASWLPLGEGEPVVKLRLRPSDSVQPEDLAAAIDSRCTNRRMFMGPPLTPGESEALSAAATAGDEVRLVWLTGAARRRALSLIWSAESERFLRRRLHDEMFSSIRFDLGWKDDAEWALAPGALEVEAPMRPMFKALRHWPLMSALRWAGVHRMLGLRAGWLPCWQAPALAVLATPRSPEAGAATAGASLQRLWLRATMLDLAVQPMAASAVLPLQIDADQAASAGLREKLRSGWAEVLPGMTPMTIVRLGRAKRPSARSKRLAVDAYLFNRSD